MNVLCLYSHEGPILISTDMWGIAPISRILFSNIFVDLQHNTYNASQSRLTVIIASNFI